MNFLLKLKAIKNCSKSLVVFCFTLLTFYPVSGNPLSNMTDSIEVIKSCAKLGYSRAQIELVNHFLHRKIEKKKITSLLKKAVANGNTLAEYYMGISYLDGRIGDGDEAIESTKDFKKASEYINEADYTKFLETRGQKGRSILIGFTRRVAFMYKNGIGDIEKSDEKALKILNKAIKFYESGIGKLQYEVKKITGIDELQKGVKKNTDQQEAKRFGN